MSGDGPLFGDDDSGFHLDGEKKREWARRMRENEAEKRRKQEEQEPRVPTEEEIARGSERQKHLNETQFREPREMTALPNPDYEYKQPPPGSYGGPPLPKHKKDPPNDDSDDPKT